MSDNVVGLVAVIFFIGLFCSMFLISVFLKSVSPNYVYVLDDNVTCYSASAFRDSFSNCTDGLIHRNVQEYTEKELREVCHYE